VVKTVTHEDVTAEELGGAISHTTRSGVADLAFENDVQALLMLRRLYNYLPLSNREKAPVRDSGDPTDRMDLSLDTLVPDNANKPYDMKELILKSVDDGDFFELQAGFAPNIICGFGRLDGFAVGVVANQPRHLAGTIDIDASEKAARFVRTCDAFNVPLIVFEDVPGFLPGIEQEHEGIIRRGSKLLYAFAEATVPRITVITRKAYGGAYVVMNSKHIGADFAIAWPTAEIAVMGPEAAVGLVFRKELAETSNPASRRAELVAEYEDLFASPWQAAGRGYIDDVIEPRHTRPWLIRAMTLARAKRTATPARKHGNIPL
jgi:propionyl-CoA carboxylase beta chain